MSVKKTAVSDCIKSSDKSQKTPWTSNGGTAQKMKFSIKDFFSKRDQIRRKLQIWSHLLKKFVMENFIFCAIFDNFFDPIYLFKAVNFLNFCAKFKMGKILEVY